MVEVRRIVEDEAAQVAALWDRMCRDAVDGGPLTERGRHNIERMLAASAEHGDGCCLVAVDEGALVGFVCCEVSAGAGLLPGLVGEISALYVTLDARRRGTSSRLADAAVTWLRRRGAGTVRTLVCIDAADTRRFWEQAGFAADMVCLSMYPAD